MSEHACCRLPYFVLASTESYSPFSLRVVVEVPCASSSCVDLRLDDDEGRFQLLPCCEGFFDGEGGFAAQDRQALLAQQLFGLMFVNVHAFRFCLLFVALPKPR